MEKRRRNIGNGVVEKITRDEYHLICPHCDHRKGAASEWVKTAVHKDTCVSCKKEYIYWREITHTFYAKAIVKEENDNVPLPAATGTSNSSGPH